MKKKGPSKRAFKKFLDEIEDDTDEGVDSSVQYASDTLYQEYGEIMDEDYKHLRWEAEDKFEEVFARKPTKKEKSDIAIAVQVGIGRCVSHHIGLETFHGFISPTAWTKLRRRGF